MNAALTPIASPGTARAEALPGELVAVHRDGIAWTVRSELADELLPVGGRLARGAPPGEELRVVKHGPHRTVYRASLPSGAFYFKHFRVSGLKAMLLAPLRATKAKREWQAAREIARLGLPTFEPVAWGRIRRGGIARDSFLVSREIDDALPLDELIVDRFRNEQTVTSREAPRQESDLRQQLALSLGKLTARLHSAGVEHADFHAANVLVRVSVPPSPPGRGVGGEGERRLASALTSSRCPDGKGEHWRGLELWLIDLHRVYFRRSLSASARYRNLAILHQFFVGKSTRADRLRFYRAYQHEWNSSGGDRSPLRPIRLTLSQRRSPSALSACVADGSELNDPVLPAARMNSGQRQGFSQSPSSGTDRFEIARLEEMLATGALRGWNRADRAWRRGNRHVRKLRLAWGQARGLATLAPDWLREVCGDPEQLFRSGLVRWHKRTARCRVGEVALGTAPAPGLTHAVLKCVEPRQDWRKLLAGLRVSQVRRAWEMGHALRRRGIDTPCPILYVERRERGGRKNYLLTERIAESVNAAEFFRATWHLLPPAERCAWLAARLRRLALQIRRLHDSGFDHRDLKFPNLLVSNDPGDCRIWLLDLDGVRIWRRLPAARAAQNLARLCVSALAHRAIGRADRLRFLKFYLGEQFRRDWKSWWRSISRLSLQKLDLNRRRGRLVA
jgi:tRNA A-37 threonylcarbamoyl transferase component Bud32